MTALRQLQEAFFAKGREFDRVLKMGRTHLQDAVPMSLGSEFRGWGTTMGEEVDRISEARAAAARDQSRRHRDRHLRHRGARLSQGRGPASVRR